MQTATWTSDGETIEVAAVLDEDGDYDVWVLGTLGDRENWTTFAGELTSGKVRMEFH